MDQGTLCSNCGKPLNNAPYCPNCGAIAAVAQAPMSGCAQAAIGGTIGMVAGFLGAIALILTAVALAGLLKVSPAIVAAIYCVLVVILAVAIIWRSGKSKYAAMWRTIAITAAIFSLGGIAICVGPLFLNGP